MNYGEYALLQNSPNPFSEYTEISFILPSSSEGSLKLFDVKGQLIKEYKGDYIQGLNKIVITKKEIGIKTGVIIYTLETKDYSETKEMIVIE